MRVLKSLVRSPSTALTVSNLFAQALNFVGGLIIARQLGTVGRGETSIVAVYDETSGKSMPLGVAAAAGWKAGQADERDVERIEGEVLGSALRLSAYTMPFAVAIGWTIQEYALGSFSSSISLLVWVAIASTPIVNTLPLVGRMILTARGALRRLGVVLVGQMVLRLAGFGLLILVDQFSAASASIAFLLSNAGGAVLVMVLVGRLPRRGGNLKELLRYGVRTIPATFSELTNTRLDQLLIAPILSTSELGLYAVAVGVAFVPINVGAAMALSIYRVAARDEDTDRVKAKFRMSLIVIAVTGLVSAIGAAILIEPVYGAEFSDSVAPALLLIAGAVALGSSLVVVQVANAVGQPAIGSWSSVSALIVTLVGLALLLPVWGIVGAAIVSLSAYTVRFAVALRLARSRALL